MPSTCALAPDPAAPASPAAPIGDAAALVVAALAAALLAGGPAQARVWTEPAAVAVLTAAALLAAVVGARAADRLARWAGTPRDGAVGVLVRAVPPAAVLGGLTLLAGAPEQVTAVVALAVVSGGLRRAGWIGLRTVAARARDPRARRAVLTAVAALACLAATVPGTAAAGGAATTSPVAAGGRDLPAAASCGDATASRRYDVAAINVHLAYNRWGQGNPEALVYVLQGDKSAVRDWHRPLGTTSSNRRLRPRPLVLRANEGECVAVRFTNELDLQQGEGLPDDPRASMTVRGIPFDVQRSGGSNVGHNDDSTVGRGETTTYFWTAPEEGTFFFHDSGMPAGSEADGGSLASGLYGAFVVEPAGSRWTDPVSGKDLYTATTGQSGELYLQADITPPSGKPFRETVQLAQDELPHTSTFAFNYGSEDAHVRTGEGCGDCVGEETSLSSWVHGDPALVKLASGLGPWAPGTPEAAEDCGLGTPGFETDSCFTANVTHTYRGDPVKIRFGMAGVKETHVFHLHAHQWLAEERDDGGTGSRGPGPGSMPDSQTIDSQTFGPMEMFTADLLFGAGSKNGTVGDSIFHCHLYPHFVRGFWGLLRVHDVREDGTGETPDGIKVAALRALPDRTSPVAPTADNPGYPRFIPGKVGWRAPQPPLGITRDGVAEPRYVAGAELAEDSPAVAVERAVMDRLSGGSSVPGAPFGDPCPSGARQVTYEVSAIQLRAVYNERGDFDAQARVLVLDRDVEAVLSGRKKPEPLFARVNAGDCITWKLTNRVPNWHGDDAFVKMAQTNMFGQHIHLVKFDVLASDGATNGWNYQQAAFSDAQDRFNERTAADPSLCTAASCRVERAPGDDPFVGSAGIAPGQTITERWYADYELRTVFTHDHHFAALDQNRGQYGAVVVEPRGTDFRNPVTGAFYQPVNDPAHGQPCGTACTGGAAGASMDVIGPGPADDFREFGLAIADFVALTRGGGDPRSRADAINPPLVPEDYPDEDPGSMAVNYRNAPLELRREKDGRRVDPAYAFSSHVFGDPATPVLQAYGGDDVRVRLIQGSQEEQHVLAVHGVRWRREPDDPQAHLVDALPVGVSEAFNFEVPRLGCKGAECRGDYLYTSTSTDDVWAGMWGLLRVNGGRVPHLLPLPDNPQTGTVSVPAPDPAAMRPPARPGPGTPCPASAPVRRFDVAALQARVTYNDEGDHDPFGLVYALEDDVAGIRAGRRPEPLVLRVHEGDCVEVTLRNALTPALQQHQGEGDPELPGRPRAATRAPGLRVSMHPGLLTYDVRGSDGTAVGYNADQTAGPGESVLYRWWAEDVTPGELGAVGLSDFGDVVGHRHHGLLAGLVVEPRGASWHDPVTGAPATGPMADVRRPGAPDFREAVVFAQDGLNLRAADGSLIGAPAAPPEPAGHPAAPTGGEAMDVEDEGEKGYSYRSEPFRHRYHGDPASDPSPGARALADVYDSGQHGDPATPLLRAYEGDQLRVRLVMATDKPRQHTFDVAGHSFLASPEDPGSRRVATASGLGGQMVVNAELGRTNTPGDYLYGGILGAFHRSGGLWGLLRVYPAPDAAGALAPTALGAPGSVDDPRAGGHPLLPLELDTLAVTAFHDRDGDGTQDDGEPRLGGLAVQAAQAGRRTHPVRTGDDGVAHLPSTGGTWTVTATGADGAVVGTATAASPGDGTTRGLLLPVRDPGGAAPPPATGDPTTALVRTRAFHDRDRDRVRDDDERALAGVTVTASREGGAPLAARTTEAGLGDLELEPGTWRLTLTPPAGYRVVTAPRTVTTGPAGSVQEVVVGLARPAARIVVRAFGDRDRDGRRDAGEPWLRRATVAAVVDGRTAARATTDGAGRARVTVPSQIATSLRVRPPGRWRPRSRTVRPLAPASATTVLVGVRAR